MKISKGKRIIIMFFVRRGKKIMKMIILISVALKIFGKQLKVLLTGFKPFSRSTFPTIWCLLIRYYFQIFLNTFY